MHGEFKVPGGKLVVADLDVVDGRISDFRLSGDFFLEPDEALGAIDAAVNGLLAETDARTLAAAVQSALPDGAQLLGFAPESVATAIRRALAEGDELAGLRLAARASRPAEPADAPRPRRGARPGGRRRNAQAHPAHLGVGRAGRRDRQLPVGEERGGPENAEKYGFRVVRRISGGGAMFMDAGSVVTYSIYAPVDLVAGMTFADSYAFFDEWAVQALRSLGVDATYQPLNDIASPAGKIGGAAQKRLGNGGVLHHVTMAYDMDGDRMTEVLRIGREKLSDKGTKSAAKRVDPLRSQTGVSRAEIIERMIETFRTQHGLTDGEITPEEYAAAEQLVAEKFGTDEWLYRVP